MILVIAPNHRIATEWAQRKAPPGDTWKYVFRPEDLRGWRLGTKVVFISIPYLDTNNRAQELATQADRLGFTVEQI